MWSCQGEKRKTTEKIHLCSEGGHAQGLHDRIGRIRWDGGRWFAVATSATRRRRRRRSLFHLNIVLFDRDSFSNNGAPLIFLPAFLYRASLSLLTVSVCQLWKMAPILCMLFQDMFVDARMQLKDPEAEFVPDLMRDSCILSDIMLWNVKCSALVSSFSDR